MLEMKKAREEDPQIPTIANTAGGPVGFPGVPHGQGFTQ